MMGLLGERIEDTVVTLRVIHTFMDSGRIWEARQALEALMVEHGMEVSAYDTGEANTIV